MSETSMPPTLVQATPEAGGHFGLQIVLVSELPTRVKELPSSKHQRVSVAGFSFRMTLPFWVTLKTMLGSSQHHHHHGNSDRILGLANLLLMSAVRCVSGAKLCAWASPNPWPRIRLRESGRI